MGGGEGGLVQAGALTKFFQSVEHRTLVLSDEAITHLTTDQLLSGAITHLTADQLLSVAAAKSFFNQKQNNVKHYFLIVLFIKRMY